MIGWHIPYNCCKVLPSLIIGLCTSDSGWTWGVVCLLYENCFACRSVGNGWRDSYFTHLEKQVWCMTWCCWELLHVLQDRVWLGYHSFRKMWMQLDQIQHWSLANCIYFSMRCTLMVGHRLHTKWISYPILLNSCCHSIWNLKAGWILWSCLSSSMT